MMTYSHYSFMDHPPCVYNRSCRIVSIPSQVPMHWALPLYGYVMPVIVMLTLATNSFIVIVLSQKYLRTSTNYVLLSMAISELLTGLSVMPWFMYYFTLSDVIDFFMHELNEVRCRMRISNVKCEKDNEKNPVRRLLEEFSSSLNMRRISM
ncbi:hypothetical protein DICVIV_10283 [Dictyocaulus viviparus]|uniref:G-protein coupled receptors family 1 profile domain-containing protein n=1 Tax=Dictyocaulus viviparus TaxID=29172 RepID=A0A0D8XIV5_DICVI|nr:hypothetical protein DICVIV_10283 [Dictyocaulus viviparus]